MNPTDILARYRHLKVLRYAAYAVAFVLWLPLVIRDMFYASHRELRVNWADYAGIISGTERYWAEKKRAEEQASLPLWARQKPMPSNTGNTIKFRRYVPYSSLFEPAPMRTEPALARRVDEVLMGPGSVKC